LGGYYESLKEIKTNFNGKATIIKF